MSEKSRKVGYVHCYDAATPDWKHGAPAIISSEIHLALWNLQETAYRNEREIDWDTLNISVAYSSNWDSMTLDVNVQERW